MNLDLSTFGFFLKRPCALALVGCFLLSLDVIAAVPADSAGAVAAQTNAFGLGTNFAARTSVATQPATNLMNASSAAHIVGPATNSLSIDPGNSMTNLDDKYKLAIGDRLSFRIVEDEDDPKGLFVSDSGDVEFPYIGRVPAEGKTCRQLATDVKAALEKEYYYQATVMIAVDLMTKSHGWVYLIGGVKEPGAVPLPSDEVMTLSKAILRAGGFTDYANKHKVKVTRKGATAKDEKKTFVVDVGEIFDHGKIESDMIVEPDDFILVPDRLVRF